MGIPEYARREAPLILLDASTERLNRAHRRLPIEGRLTLLLATRGIACLDVEGKRWLLPAGAVALLGPRKSVHVSDDLRLRTEVARASVQGDSNLNLYIGALATIEQRELDRAGVSIEPVLEQAVIRLGWLSRAALESLSGSMAARRQALQRLVAAHNEVASNVRTSGHEMAAIAAMSYGNFNRSFRACFGSSPKQHIIAYRMRVACALLGCSRAGLATIADHCGYDNRSAFSRAFRQSLGYCPSDYRDRQRRTSVSAG